MHPLMSALSVMIVIVLGPITLFCSQDSPKVSPAERAQQEVEGVYTEAKNLSDKRVAIRLQAQVARLLWPYSRDRARAIFQELWEQVEQTKDIDREAARTEILRELFPRDPALATRWLEQIATGHQRGSAPLKEQIGGTDPGLRPLAALSSQLVEQNPEIAAILLERHLSVSVSPHAFTSLLRLREKESRLADYIFTRTLESLRTRPTVVALPGIYVLVDYAFPDRSRAGFVNPPEAALQMHYFWTAYELLQKSLAESQTQLRKEQGYSEQDLRFRSIFQGHVAAVLSALAPRYAPERVEELKKLAADLPSGTNSRFDPAVARLSEGPIEGASTEVAFSIALGRGDVEEAKRLLEKVQDASVKKTLSQALRQAEFRTHLARSHFADALMAARGIEDADLRALFEADVATAAFQKGEKELAKLALMEAQMTLSGAPDSKGVRIWTALSLASDASLISESISLHLLWSAVPLLNALVESSDTRSKGDVFMPDALPRLRESSELWRTFASVGRVNFDETLLIAYQIRDDALRLMARLATCEAWLNGADLITNRSER